MEPSGLSYNLKVSSLNLYFNIQLGFFPHLIEWKNSLNCIYRACMDRHLKDGVRTDWPILYLFSLCVCFCCWFFLGGGGVWFFLYNNSDYFKKICRQPKYAITNINGLMHAFLFYILQFYSVTGICSKHSDYVAVLVHECVPAVDSGSRITLRSMMKARGS